MINKEKAPASTRAKFETNSNYILIDVPKFIMKKYERISRSFWVTNYNLEMFWSIYQPAQRNCYE